MKRKLAWLGILIIASVFVALVYCTVTGASANTIMAFMVCLILVPVLIHGIILFQKINDRKNETIDKKENDLDQH